MHDFKKPIEETSVSMAKVILNNMIENFDTFVYEDIDMTPEQNALLAEKGADFGIEIMKLMSATDIPADYATYSIDKLIAGLSAVKNYVDGTIRQMHDEIMARSLGAKSPVTNTYAKDCATLGDVMMLLKKVREETGNIPSDYFIEKKPEISTVEPIAVEETK